MSQVDTSMTKLMTASRHFTTVLISTEKKIKIMSRIPLILLCLLSVVVVPGLVPEQAFVTCYSPVITANRKGRLKAFHCQKRFGGCSSSSPPAYRCAYAQPSPTCLSSSSLSLSSSSYPSEADVPIISDDTTTNNDDNDGNKDEKNDDRDGKKKNKIRRQYETFQWSTITTTKDDGVSTGTYNINYRVEGPVDGQPIMLVHGFGANVNHFRFQFPALVAEGYRVYAIDLLGFGKSDKPADAAYSIELFVSLVVDLMDFIDTKEDNDDKPSKANHKGWIVAGNSIGGLVSLGVASAKQKVNDPVCGIVLFNCAGGMSGFRYEDVPFLVRPILFFVQKVLLGPEWGGSFFADFKTRENVEAILRSQGVYRDQTNVNDDLLEILLEPGDDEGAETVFLKTFGGPPGPTPESILPTLDCPILALWGGADPWTPVDRGMHPGTGFSRYAKGEFDLVVIPGAGHCPHDEVPDKIHSRMIPWLKALGEK